MRLIRLEIHNFLSIESAVLDFKPGLYFINGINHDMSVGGSESNGTGKSALCGEAIEWIIWGTLSRISSKSGKPIADSVVNSKVGKNCYGSLVFESGGKEWKIIRTRKHEKLGNSLSWFVDGNDKSKHDKDETQEDIEKALSISHTVFRHAVQVGQGLPYKFLSLTEVEKQNLLCDILNLKVYDNAIDVTKNNISVWETKISSTAGYIDDIERQIHNKEQEVDIITNDVSLVDSEILNLQRKPVEDSIKDIKQDISSLEERVILSTTRFDNSVLHREELMKKYKDAVDKSHVEVAEAENKRQEFLKETSRNAFEIESRGREWDQKISSLSREINNLDGQRIDIIQSEKCEYCGSKLKDPDQIKTKIAEVESHIEKKKNELEYSRSSKDKFTLVLNNYKADVHKASQEWDLYISTARDKAKKDVSLIEKSISDVNQTINELNLEKDSYFSKLKINKLRVADLESILRKTLDKENSLKMKKAVLEEKISMMSKSIQDDKLTIEASKVSLREQTKIFDHWKYWKQSIPNLRAAAMEQILQYLNHRVNEYLNIFSSGIMGMEMFQESRGKGSRVKVDLRTPGGTYDMSSGGERRRIDLAIYLALSDLVHTASGVSCNFIVADEIMDGLSPEGVRKFAEILKMKAESGMCVFVVSHNPSVRQMVEFDETITLERRNGKANIIGMKIKEKEWNTHLVT